MNTGVSGSRTSLGDLFSIDSELLSMERPSAISVQVTSIGTATVVFEQSNDGVNWRACQGWPVENPNVAGLSGTTAIGLFVFPFIARFFRARVSAYTSGTVTAFGLFQEVLIRGGDTRKEAGVFCFWRDLGFGRAWCGHRCHG
jgi:hypothetical protein